MSIGLVLSDILGVSCFIILAGNCLFWAKFLGFGGKYGSDFNFSFYNPKNAHPYAIPRLLSHCASKSVQGSPLYVGPRKKTNK